MSYFEGNYYSLALQKQVMLSVILPNDAIEVFTQGNPHYERETKLLFLLHGYSENYRAWLSGSSIQELSIKYNIAVVMPSGENSFYLNQKGSGKAYETFVGVELVEYMRKTFGLTTNRENTFIGGLSMGGFGAIHTGLKYNNTFGKIFALSSALIVNEIKNQGPEFSNTIANYDYYVSTFGNLSELENSENNPEYLVKQIKQKGMIFPDLYLACGTEDFLIEHNREFYRFLKEQEVPVTYYESEGEHNWVFWNYYLEKLMTWLV